MSEFKSIFKELQQLELEKLKLEHSSLPFQRPVAQDALKATLVKSLTNHTEMHRSVISSTSCILWCRKPHSKCFRKFLSQCRPPQSKQNGFNSESGERSVSKVAAVSFHLGSCAALAAVVNSSPRVNRTLLTLPFISFRISSTISLFVGFLSLSPKQSSGENIKVCGWRGGATSVSSPNVCRLAWSWQVYQDIIWHPVCHALLQKTTTTKPSLRRYRLLKRSEMFCSSEHLLEGLQHFSECQLLPPVHSNPDNRPGICFKQGGKPWSVHRRQIHTALPRVKISQVFFFSPNMAFVIKELHLIL